MKVLVTGSSGHLGEALMRLLPEAGHAAAGIDLRPGPFTQHLGSVADPKAVAAVFAAEAPQAVIHSATLHKPHIATHDRRAFVETNVTGTLTLLDAAKDAGARRFVLSSTTSAFGAALSPPPDRPAAWIDRWVPGEPKNIYGVTKAAAEDLCHLYHRRFGLECTVLRVARFFPEPDDDPAKRRRFPDANAKANEFAFRRVDLYDAATAHIRALDAALPRFERYVIAATTPFRAEDRTALRQDAAAVLRRRLPDFARVYDKAGYRMFPAIDRVYVNTAARADLRWRPVYDFARILGQIAEGDPVGSALSRQVGIKGYHGAEYADGIYPVETDPPAPAASRA